MLKTSEIEKILSRDNMPKLKNILTPHLITKVNTIYKITNIVNSKCYIGQTSKMTIERWQEHIRDLRRGTHHSSKLQNAYNKYGEENFTFEVIVCTLKSFLNEKEIYWIDYFDSYYNGYNETLGGDSNPMLNPEVAEKLYKPVYQYNLEGELVKTYSSCSSVEEDGFDLSVVSQACNNKYYNSCIYRNHIWSYKPLTEEQLKKILDEYEPRSEKASKSAKKAWSDPKIYAKRVEAAKISMNRPEVKAKKSETKKENDILRIEKENKVAQKSAKEAISKTANKKSHGNQKIGNDLYIYIAEQFLRGLYPNKSACSRAFGVDSNIINDMFNYKYCRKSCRQAIIELCKKYNYPMKGLEVSQ